MPVDAINKTKKNEAYLINSGQFAANSPEVQNLCNKADIIIIERNFFGDNLTMIMYWKVRNKMIVANFDDAYDMMRDTNIAYPFWVLGSAKNKTPEGEVDVEIKPLPLTQFKWGLRMVAGIMLPSKVLMKDWDRYSDAYYVPNYVDITHYKNVIKEDNGDNIIIGWGGSLSHVQSFEESGIIKALQKICKNYPQVKIMIAGDKRVYDKINLPDDKKTYNKFVKFSEWPKVLANFDIGLAPLCGQYDQRRSWIKPLEYMLLKIPWIGSDNKSYDDIKQYGKVIKNQQNIWYTTIEEMIQNLDDHRKFAKEEPYKFAMNQTIDKNVSKILNTCKEIIDKGYNE